MAMLLPAQASANLWHASRISWDRATWLCRCPSEKFFSHLQLLDQTTNNSQCISHLMDIPMGAVQNALLQLPSGHLPGAVWHASYQGKILATALPSLLILGKALKDANGWPCRSWEVISLLWNFPNRKRKTWIPWQIDPNRTSS